MKKRFTLLITVTALLLGGGGGKVWGQTMPGPASNGPLSPTIGCGTYTISSLSWSSPDNNFGPGERGIIRPNAAPSQNSGYWQTFSNTGTTNGFSTNSGVITIGGTTNVVKNHANTASVGGTCTTSYTNSSGVSSGNITARSELNAPANEISVPDGTGIRQIGTATDNYNVNTEIRVDASSLASNAPWHLQQFYFLENPWYYYTYNLTTVAGHCTNGPFNHYVWNSSSNSYVYSGQRSCTYNGVTYTNGTLLGGYVDGIITLNAGSHVRLDGTAQGNISIGAATTRTHSVATVHLPATHYSLMNDKNLDEASIAAGVGGTIDWGTSGGTILGVNAVLGINGNYVPATNIITNVAGGTILLGQTTGGQANMVITPSTGSGTVTKSFQSSGNVYTGSHYFNSVANVGNYGTNNVTITHAQTMVTATGTAGLQIFNQNGTCGSNALYFNGTPVAITNGTGALLIDARGAVDFYQTSTFTATAANAGHTTIRGGNEVRFRAAHTYDGSKASDYWVHAVGAATYNSTSYCGNGDIIAQAAAPVIAKNVGGNGNLNWQAKRDIETNARVEFVSDLGTNVDWRANDNEIRTNDTVIFTNNASATGYTKWYAGTNIKTSSNISPLTAANGVKFTHSGTGLTEWKANTGNIETKNIINFLKNNGNAATQTTEWWAKQNILTDRMVTFENNGDGWTKWHADANNIETGLNGGAGATGRVTFINNKGGSTTAYTEWYAQKNIITNGHINFYNHTDSYTKWTANDNDIYTKDSVYFENTKFGNTDWWAGVNIYTEKPVDFINAAASTGYIKWWANAGDIITGYGAANQGLTGRVNFQNLNPGSTTSDITWSAYNNIITNDYVNFNNLTKSNVLWQARNQSIETNDSVTFNNTSSGNTTWSAAQNITTNDTVEFTNFGTGNTLWHAIAGNITTNRTSPGLPNENGFVTFNNHGGTGSNTDWWAGKNIFTNNVVTFNNESDTVKGAYIKWRAQGSGAPTTGNIEMNDSTIFNQLGTVASGGDNLRGKGNTTPGFTPTPGSLWLLAHNNIYSENNAGPINSPTGQNEEPLLINYAKTNDAPIMLHAVNGSVVLDGVTHIERMSQGGTTTIPTYTTIEAGIDINLLDTFTVADSSAYADILLHAGRDIVTNWRDISGASVCDTEKEAPVTFEVRNYALTHWVADRNIITKDTVNFKYASTNNRVRDLNIVARGGNIETYRWFNIAYDSDNRILFSAVKDMPPALNFSYPYLPAGGIVANGPDDARHTNNGNIHFNDSMKITRTNKDNGTTDILAKYNIRTAMVDYVDSFSLRNNTKIESYIGDIFLGYSTLPNTCAFPPLPSSAVGGVFDYDTTRFKYTVLNPAHDGLLDIKAGFEDATDNNNRQDGGNIYFTHVDKYAMKSATSETKITIPFSNEYKCIRDDKLNVLGNAATFSQSRIQYEHSGIIGGVGPCGEDPYAAAQYAPMQELASTSNTARDTSLIYFGNQGNLLVDAGLRGNIIINRSGYLNFQDNGGNTEFRTREGNIDMRYKFDVDSMQGSLLYLASSDLPNKLKVSACDCDEMRNNVYLQDFQYNSIVNSGSIFVGADNNIKLQYGGLKTIGTNRDPFFSPNNDGGYPCGKSHHCDSDTSKNLARDLILNFANDAKNAPITRGGFAAVASDLIDVYKNMVYNGGQGTGMSTVPKYTNLHGESVAGYGLYIKTQANKSNWTKNAFDPGMTACFPDKCDIPCVSDVLQNVARVTFHSDARVYAENQRVYIGSPVLESYGNLDLNTHDHKGAKTAITIQTDSLIAHDSLIIDGKLTNFTTWSGLYRDMPIFKLGHQRFTPPTAEDGCKSCYTHSKGKGSVDKGTALDTVFVTFRHGAKIPRLHTLVADHAVISFLTDSFDHVKGDPTINAKFYTDTFKVRNHVELWNDSRHEHDGHFELVSEIQMGSKDYAGIYSRHLHMEPIAPTCARDFKYSQLWLQDPALDVITSSTFGGYGWIHADVHVEIEATLAPGFASLREKGNYCYELIAGTLKMQDLRLDKGAQLRYSIGSEKGFDGEVVDVIEVDELTLYGSVDITVEKRCGQRFEEGCYPLIRYNSIAVDTVNLNNLKLKTKQLDGYLLTLDTSIPGTVYLCVGNVTVPQLLRTVYIPQTEGVTTTPDYGIHNVVSQDNFKFKAKYTTEQPLKVVTNRLINGKEEELFGSLNENGEYEYVIRQVAQNIILTFGPDFASVDNASIINGKMVWSHNNTIYFRVEKEDIASIYSIAGQLVKRIELPEGDSSVPMERGVYIVTLKDGSVHKVILK